VAAGSGVGRGRDGGCQGSRQEAASKPAPLVCDPGFTSERQLTVMTTREHAFLALSEVVYRRFLVGDNDVVDCREDDESPLRSWWEQHRAEMTVQFRVWANGLTPTRIRSWEVHLYTAEGVRSLPFSNEFSTYGVPLAFVVKALDELASAGWILQHVSEDPGLTDGHDEAVPVRLRYLLVRDVGAQS
jgi:hypothetical protein